MSKIRLTEAQLHRVIKESVKKILRENDENSSWDIRIGDIVIWHDPAGETGGKYKVYSIDGMRNQIEFDRSGMNVEDDSIIGCSSKYGEVEAYPIELEVIRHSK